MDMMPGTELGVVKTMTMLLAFNSLAAVEVCDWWYGTWTPLSALFTASGCSDMYEDGKV